MRAGSCKMLRLSPFEGERIEVFFNRQEPNCQPSPYPLP
jgi:hypothetical protein